MNSSAASEFLKNFETSNIIATLQNLNLQELVHSPYFLGGTAALAIICLVMRWRLLLATVLGISGFAWLLSYTLARDTSLDGGIGNDTLVVFVAGGAGLVFLVIYLLFIRSE
jgi:peptidoglycan/LPS O-acetylase OafA/YrhL